MAGNMCEGVTSPFITYRRPWDEIVLRMCSRSSRFAAYLKAFWKEIILAALAGAGAGLLSSKIWFYIAKSLLNVIPSGVVPRMFPGAALVVNKCSRSLFRVAVGSATAMLFTPMPMDAEDPLLESLLALLNSEDPQIHSYIEEVKAGEAYSELAEPIDLSKMRAVAKAALHAKSRFGIMAKTEANRLVIRRSVVEEMTAWGMRPTHIAQAADLATLLSFIPTDYEMRAAQATKYGPWIKRVEFLENPFPSGSPGPILKFDQH